MLKEKNLTNCNAPTILMKGRLTIKMNKPDNYDEVDLTIYQQLIGKFIYLACKTKLNVAFVVRKLGKYNINPCKKLFRTAQQVLCYLKKTIYLELVYIQYPYKSLPTSPTPYKLVRYKNSNFVGDPKGRKSVIKYYFFFNDTIVLWLSKKQKTISMSITKAKYIVISHKARKKI